MTGFVSLTEDKTTYEVLSDTHTQNQHLENGCSQKEPPVIETKSKLRHWNWNNMSSSDMLDPVESFSLYKNGKQM